MEIITEKGEYYDLPEDYTIDFEFINPVLDDIGSQTAPGTLPYTRHNLRLLDYPDRMDRARKYTVKRNITLRENSFQKPASQLIIKANTKDKIVSTFYLDEAIFYEKIKNVDLKDIDWPVIHMNDYDMRSLFNDVMMLRREEDFCIFPVSIGFNGQEKTGDISNYEEPNWLNQIYYPAATIVSASEPELWWRGREDENVPAYNYGLTPFLRMSYIMEKIAEHLGYTFEYNVFREHAAFRHLVLINNVIDSSIGCLDYSRLIPARPVSELIILLATKFGIKILCDDLNKKLFTLIIEDTITQKPDFDFTPFLTEKPKIEWTENGQLKLSAQTSIPGAKPFCNTWKEFISRFPDIQIVNKRSEINKSFSYDDYAFYIKSENSYWVKVGETAYEGTQSIKAFYSPFFNHYDEKQKTGSVVDFSASDEQLPMMEYDNTGTPSAADSVKNFKILAPNIDSCMHLVTRFSERGDQSSMPFMFCFQLPYLQHTSDGFFPGGTTSKYDWNGNAWNDFSLSICGKDGIQEKLWKKYDEMIRHSYQSVTCSMNLPLSVLQNLKLYTPKMLFNQPILIERIKCKIGNGKCKITEAVFRTLRPYED